MTAMRILLIIFSVFAFLSTAFAQGKTAEAADKAEKADVMPEFPGGKEALLQFIKETKKYPAEAQKNNIKGNVFVEFVIDKTGKVLPETIKVIWGVHPLLDEEAMRVVRQSPPWKPGRVSRLNKTVPVKYALAVKFDS
jgi:TonB family protein